MLDDLPVSQVKLEVVVRGPLIISAHVELQTLDVEHLQGTLLDRKQLPLQKGAVPSNLNRPRRLRLRQTVPFLALVQTRQAEGRSSEYSSDALGSNFSLSESWHVKKSNHTTLPQVRRAWGSLKT